MKQIIVLILMVSMSICIDECLQLTSHKKCIGTINLQCMWTGQICRESSNYLLGCNKKLSPKLCVKQVGLMNGTITKCIFDDHCHNIYDSYTLLCSNLLSKSACLAITNPQQFCQWKNGECINLSNEEIGSLSSQFGNLELSASACGLINGYLIIHSSILWNLIGYIPDLGTEAFQKPQEIDLGLQLTGLQDNYVDSKGQFIWYTTETQLTPAQLKINDSTRYGCIAQEILTNKRFTTLFNMHEEVIRGVNHVYCNYLNKHPTNPILTVFVNNECRQVKEDQLQELIINCESMGGIVCQRYFNKKCIIISKSEYECQETQNFSPQNQCLENLGTATHQICSQVIQEICYLDISQTLGYCTNLCSQAYTQSICESSGNCFWLGQNLNNLQDSSNSQFIVCSPVNSCDQLGINYLYCKQLAANCVWEQQKCKSITEIEQLNCSDCNTIYCCSSIKRADQYCLWNKDQCINVQDQPLFSHFLSFPEIIIMNQNLCFSQTGQFNYYDLETRTCKLSSDLYLECVKFDDEDFKIDGKECNNGITDRINKEYCLSLVNQYTRWDIFQQKCIHIADTNIKCDEMTLVNQNLCTLAITTENQLCLYDVETWSCYYSNIIQLHCNTKGISKDQCLNNQVEYCVWIDNQCQYFDPYSISLESCEYLQNVSPNVCRIANYIDDQCLYNSDLNSCQINYNQLNNCDGFWNAIACQKSQGSCYFDNILQKCDDASKLLNILECEHSYISKSTCLSITTEGQRCIWSTTSYDQVMKCRKYVTEFYTTCDSYSGKSNIHLCSALTANVQQRIDFNQQCELINQVCQSKITPILDQDCGYASRNMNLYRCMAYTLGECYFDNYKCTPITQQTNYKQLILKQITCDQCNMQICNQVLTQGQVCFQDGQNKCNIFSTLIVYNCSQLSLFDMTIYSPQLCSLASDACYFNKSINKCSIPQNDQFNCDQIGASKSLCIGYTIGQCVFSDNFCLQSESKSLACEIRNKKACFSGGLQCIWNSQQKVCIQQTIQCPAQYNDSYQWQICGASTSKCFAGKNGCVQIDSKYIPCWLSLSSTSCANSQQYCQWINNQCTDSDYQCEDAKTLEKCVLHRQRNCVYKHNQCFEISTPKIYDCDDFDYTTSQFCRLFYPQCIYTSSYQCQFIYYFGESKQRDADSLVFGNFINQITQYSCLLQRQLPLHYRIIVYSTYITQFCQTSVQVHTQCAYFSQTAQSSILACESVPNCGFKMTLAGEPFCHPLPLTCEQLDSNFCLKDIPGINCYLEKSQCKSYLSQLTCSSVDGLQINRELCINIMKNDTNTEKCYYDNQTKLCKKIRKLETDCTSITDYYGCIFTSKSCIVITGSNTISCINSTNQFDPNINLFGCTQLVDNLYYFSINTYTCKYFTDNSEIIPCHLLNQKSCLTSMIDQKCIWSNNRCEKYQIKHELIDCSYRNYQSCINSTSKNCVWVMNQCIESNNSLAECNNTCTFSEAYCRSIDKFWDGMNCYNISDLPISFFKCSGLGLNEQQCLQNTTTQKCYWDGVKCMEAVLEIIECNMRVSQTTCLSITTPLQTCIWQNNACQNTYNLNDCGYYNNLAYCRQAKVPCQFNLASHKCVSINQIEICQDTLSQKACENVINDFCLWSNKKCQRWPKMRYSCQSIHNKWGCLNSIMYCKWTNSCENINSFAPVPCKSIPFGFNRMACIKYASDQCLFDEKTQACDVKLNSSFINSMNADQSYYIQVRMIYECTQFTNILDCVGSRVGLCEWINDSCINCQNSECNQNSCNNKNINQCMKLSNLSCAWRDNRCVTWIFNPKYTLADLTLVTQKCCTQLNALIKYEKQLNSCIEIDAENDSCETLGLSKYGCLHLKKHQCIYVNGVCQAYQFKYQVKCTDYVDISQYVCQQLPHLKCKFDLIYFKCLDFDQDMDSCLTAGLSIQGCTSITNEPCYWNIDYCVQFTPDPSIDQCNGSFKSNALTCQVINNTTGCSYNHVYHTCQNRFNRYSKCSEPGLNLQSCVSTIREPCHFEDGKCQRIQTFESTCSLLINTNELACKMNKKDFCAYDPISKNCYSAFQDLPCTFPGLNQNSCSNYDCKWSSDINTCQCNQLEVQQICDLYETDCLKDERCRFENQYCRVQHCDDLIDCQGFVNKETCYLNYQNECQGASKCEDIINLSSELNCNDFVFDGSNCVQIHNYCISGNSYSEICINSDCQNQYCKLSNSGCIPLECNDYALEECFFYNGCNIIDNQCQEIFSCSEIKTQDSCVNSKIDNQECSWQISGVYSDDYHCTNNYCQLLSVSPTLCNGNEMNFHSCIMDSFLQCKTCEQLTDRCDCNVKEGLCSYDNGKCKSILCQSFITEQTCLTTKCHWSNRDQVCRKKCEFIIIQDECEALDYECYWNSYNTEGKLKYFHNFSTQQ